MHVSNPELRNKNLVAASRGPDGSRRYVARGMIPLEGPWPYYELSSGWVSLALLLDDLNATWHCITLELRIYTTVPEEKLTVHAKEFKHHHCTTICEFGNPSLAT